MTITVRERLLGATRVDRSRLAWWAALRSLIVYQVLVTTLLLTGHETMALPVASGIVLTALADAGESVGRRWRTMLWAALWITLATLVGGLVANRIAVSVLIGVVVALLAGWAWLLGTRAGAIGVLSLVSYVVFNGAPDSQRSAVGQAIGVLVGAVAITLVTVLPHLRDRQSWLRAQAPVPGIRARLHGSFDARNVYVRHGVRLAIVIGIAMLLSQTDEYPHDYWLPMTVAWVTKPDKDGTSTRIVQRILGTIAGILVSALVIDGLRASSMVIAVFAGCGLALAVLFVTANYSVAVIGVTVLIVSLFTFDGDPVGETMVLRICMTIAAGVLAFLAFYLWPPEPRHGRAHRAGSGT